MPSIADDWVASWAECQHCHNRVLVEGGVSRHQCAPPPPVPQVVEHDSRSLPEPGEDPDFDKAVCSKIISTVVEQVRPKMVRVNCAGCEAQGVANLPVPDHVSPNAKRVARAVAALATRRLESGWTLEYAITHLAAGRDIVTAVLKSRGYERDRKTVAAGIAELCEAGVMDHNGQLNRGQGNNPFEKTSTWFDLRSNSLKTGAFTYRIKIVYRQLGDLADAVLDSLSRSSSYGGINSSKRVQEALKWAVDHAQQGQRNAIGTWLAGKCRNAGLSPPDGEQVMTEFQSRVAQDAHPYPLREALRTLTSVYRHPRVA